MDFPIRKQIRLKNFDYTSVGAYFITICTQNRENLFGKIIENEFHNLSNNPSGIIEKWLFEFQHKYKNVEIDKFIIMPNHIHFILKIHLISGEHIGSPLHEMVKWFKTQTTNEYIRGVKQNLYQPFDRHVWQRNYYEHIIRNEESYLKIWQYIDGNIQSWQNDELYNE